MPLKGPPDKAPHSPWLVLIEADGMYTRYIGRKATTRARSARQLTEDEIEKYRIDPQSFIEGNNVGNT